MAAAFLPPMIEHRRDVIEDASGAVEQVYNHLIYCFGEPPVATARAYLDEPGKVALLGTDAPPAEVLGYLRERFDRIDQLGRDGYRTIWP